MNAPTIQFVLYTVLVLALAFYVYRISRIAAPLAAEKRQKRWVAGITLTFLLLWLGTGSFVLFEQFFSEREIAKTLAPLSTPVFLVHLFFWMLLGMISNYLWDLFKAGKDWGSIRPTDLFLPFLISPIIFYSLWGFAANQKVSFLLALIAFQNGFFWQVIFAKAGPIVPGGGQGAVGNPPSAPPPQGPQSSGGTS